MHIDDTLAEDLGRLLSKKGGTRKVFLCQSDPTCVIKVARMDSLWPNIKEMAVWDSVYYNSEARTYLAPCVSISSDGLYLKMHRTMPITARDLPEFIPDFLSDLWLANWGMLNGRVVCHDYASFVLKDHFKSAKFSQYKEEDLEEYYASAKI